MHFFIIPATACSSSCTYCFGPGTPGSLMDRGVLKRALTLFTELEKQNRNQKTSLTFHGGEPLLAGAGYFEHALPMVREAFGRRISIGIQSNLWHLNDDLIELFKQYRVLVGTSLDGPEEINDMQRGKSYFGKTMHGIETLKSHGIDTGCISTFTPMSTRRYREVFKFFLYAGLHFELHPAVKPLHHPGDASLFPDPVTYGKFLVDMLELYLPHSERIKIGTLDTMIRSVSFGKSGLCTFTNCLGKYLAVDPSGELFTCNRFVGKKEFSLGNINKVRSWEDITRSKAWQKLKEWEKKMEKECSGCPFESICFGGCPYNAFASSGQNAARDPYCVAYKRAYSHILEKGTGEFFSDANLRDMKGDDSSMLRKGPLLKIMNNDPHPYDIRKAAIEIVSAGIKGMADHPMKTNGMLASLGIPEEHVVIPNNRLYNLYLHITSSCNLSCSYCYAYTNGVSSHELLPVDKILESISEASDLGFGKVIITGGEPMLHPDFFRLTAGIKELHKQHSLSRLVLRTNLSSEIDMKQVEDISVSFDQIVVSLDGSEQFHDARRGKGNYSKVLENIKLFSPDVLKTKVVLSAVLDDENAKRHLYHLKDQLQISDVRFLPLLPLGRAGNTRTSRPEATYQGISGWTQRRQHPRTSCGIGNNLMIDPDGSAYPCHVLKPEKHPLGNMYDQSLEEIIKSARFAALKNAGVDEDAKCRTCDYRYLCGGQCKAWKNDDCTDLYARAKNLFEESLEVLHSSIPSTPANSHPQ